MYIASLTSPQQRSARRESSIPYRRASLVHDAASFAREYKDAPGVIRQMHSVDLLAPHAASRSRRISENREHAEAFGAALPYLQAASEGVRLGDAQRVSECLTRAEA